MRTAQVRGRVASPSWATAAPRLSVIIATHQRVGFLSELFAALEAMQVAGGGIELVIANDGSTDGTWDELLRLVRVARSPSSPSTSPLLAAHPYHATLPSPRAEPRCWQ